MRRILLVEDAPELTASLALALERRYAVEVARDGSDALGRLAASVPDLIVTDLQSPSLDGAALIRACRADPRTSRVPLVLLSSGEELPAVARELRFGAWLRQPVSPQALLAHVEQLLAGSDERHPPHDGPDEQCRRYTAPSAEATPREGVDCGGDQVA